MDLNKLVSKKIGGVFPETQEKKDNSMSDKEIIDLQKKIVDFIKNGEQGTLLFSSVDKNANVKHEYVGIRLHKDNLKLLFKSYTAIKPINDVLEEISAENSNCNQINSMVQ